MDHVQIEGSHWGAVESGAHAADNNEVHLAPGQDAQDGQEIRAGASFARHATSPASARSAGAPEAAGPG